MQSDDLARQPVESQNPPRDYPPKITPFIREGERIVEQIKCSNGVFLVLTDQRLIKIGRTQGTRDDSFYNSVVLSSIKGLSIRRRRSSLRGVFWGVAGIVASVIVFALVQNTDPSIAWLPIAVASIPAVAGVVLLLDSTVVHKKAFVFDISTEQGLIQTVISQGQSKAADKLIKALETSIIAKQPQSLSAAPPPVDLK